MKWNGYSGCTFFIESVENPNKNSSFAAL
jgi:hypothetical protein